MNFINNYIEYEDLFLSKNYNLEDLIKKLEEETNKLKDLFNKTDIKYCFFNKKIIFHNTDFFPFTSYCFINDIYLYYLLGRLYILTIYLENKNKLNDFSKIFKYSITHHIDSITDIFIIKREVIDTATQINSTILDSNYLIELSRKMKENKCSSDLDYIINNNKLLSKKYSSKIILNKKC